MAGLRVGQVFGVFLLLGLGVGSSSPQVLRHPTSMCNSGVNDTGTMDLNTKLEPLRGTYRGPVGHGIA